MHAGYACPRATRIGRRSDWLLAARYASAKAMRRVVVMTAASTAKLHCTAAPIACDEPWRTCRRDVSTSALDNAHPPSAFNRASPSLQRDLARRPRILCSVCRTSEHGPNRHRYPWT